MRRSTLASLGLSLLASLALAGCKSGLGEHCQVTADCEDGLVCGSQSSTCQEDVEGVDGGGIDAAQDGPEIDTAPPVDAATDAPTDAPPDA